MRHPAEDRIMRHGGLHRCRPLQYAALLLALSTALPCAARPPAADTPDVDACSLIHDADVRTLIASPDTTIRSESTHPAPGKSTCIWSAHDKGLTGDAPPLASLSLDFYHFADAAQARFRMRRLNTPPASPDLARTDNPDDEVARPDHETVIARHGADVASLQVDASRPVWDQPDWTYRLEALAFGAAGAAVLGPVDARTTADVCQLIEPQHVLGLLTLTASTLKADPDGARRCRFDVKDASGKISGWVDNRGEAVFEREDFGNHAAALARQHADTPFFPESRLVRSTDPGDRVLYNSQFPRSASAVHGPYLVNLNLTNATPAALAAPGWTYRLQRAALEAAGATIVAQPDLPPDPVVPGPKPKPERFTWHPAPYVPPAGSAALAPIVHVLWKLAQWRFLVLPAGLVLLALGLGILKPRRRHLAWLAPLVLLYVIPNIIFGPQLGVLLIHRFGVQGQATITGDFDTGIQYNNHIVRGHNVLIRTADGQVVETTFRDDNFNVYPPHNATTYPGRNEEFTVRYLPGFPHDFAIIGDDDSPWATGLRCDRLGSAADQADAKQRFAPNSAAFRDAAAAAHRALQAAGCDTPDDD